MIVNVSVEIKKGVINPVYLPYMKDTHPMQIIYGGSSSGKSVFVSQRCVIDICNGGRNYLCVRNVKTTVRNSMFNEIVKTISRFKMTEYFTINRSDLVITCINGYQILFSGLDDVEKIKSITPAKGIITDIWIEEATEILETDLKQLQRRLRGKSSKEKRVTLTFNPIVKSHWLFERYFGKWEDDKRSYSDELISILKTTYKDNIQHLSEGDIRLLEDEEDKYYYEVYTLGNWGVLGAVIYKNWEVRDLTESRDTFDRFTNGLDFGFSHDPTAVIRTHYDKKRKTIYILDELYMRELTNDLLEKELEPMIGKEYIVCDSEEPRSIRELQNLGINARKAKKGKDSVNFGIDWLQRQKIIIDVTCQNFKNEIQQYKWKEDRDGNVLKVPVDKNDHLMDAIRYAYEDEMVSRELYAVDLKGMKGDKAI